MMRAGMLAALALGAAYGKGPARHSYPKLHESLWYMPQQTYLHPNGERRKYVSRTGGVKGYVTYTAPGGSGVWTCSIRRWELWVQDAVTVTERKSNLEQLIAVTEHRNVMRLSKFAEELKGER